MIQKLSTTPTSSTSEASALDYDALASSARLAEIASALGTSDKPVIAIVFERERAVPIGAHAGEAEAAAIADRLHASRQGTLSEHGWFAAGIGVARTGAMLIKAALVARTGTRPAASWQAMITAVAAALSRELEARLQLALSRDRMIADRRYLHRAFTAGLQEIKRVADEVRTHCMNLPVNKQAPAPSTEERAMRAAVLLADRLRGLETWLRLAEPRDASGDARRALKLATTRLRSAFALGENQLRVTEPLPAVACDETRFATLIEESVKVVLRRDLPIKIEGRLDGGEVHLEIACVEALPSEPPDALETLPFGHQNAIKGGDLSLATVEQIVRAAGGQVALGPGLRIRLTLPASEALHPAAPVPPSRSTGVEVQ